MAASLFALPDARRIRSYVRRLPLATLGLLLAITGFYIAHLFLPGLTQWGALIPQEIGISTCACMRWIHSSISADFRQYTD